MTVFDSPKLGRRNLIKKLVFVALALAAILIIAVSLHKSINPATENNVRETMENYGQGNKTFETLSGAIKEFYLTSFSQPQECIGPQAGDYQLEEVSNLGGYATDEDIAYGEPSEDYIVSIDKYCGLPVRGGSGTGDFLIVSHTGAGYEDIGNVNGKYVAVGDSRTSGYFDIYTMSDINASQTLISKWSWEPGMKTYKEVKELLGDEQNSIKKKYFEFASSESQIQARGEEVLAAIKNNDIKAFSTFVHPIEGISMGTKKWLPNDLLAYAAKSEKIFWGYAAEGSGQPIEESLADYFSQYSRIDYTKAPQFAFNRVLRGGSTSPNLLIPGYPDKPFMSYFYPFTSTYIDDNGLTTANLHSWEALNLVFDVGNDGKWYVIAIGLDYYTI